MLLVERSKEMATLLTFMVDVPLLQSDTPLVFKISVASTDGRSASEAKATTEDVHMFVSRFVYH